MLESHAIFPSIFYARPTQRTIGSVARAGRSCQRLHCLPSVPIEQYYQLPSTAGKYSYDFMYGMVAEMGNCPTHGSLLRKLNEEGLEKVLRYCRSVKPMMYSEALAAAYGSAWAGTPEMWTRLVWVYNPEEHPLSEILVIDISLAFDEIIVEETSILIPYYYSIKEGIISGCGSCPPIELPFAPK